MQVNGEEILDAVMNDTGADNNVVPAEGQADATQNQEVATQVPEVPQFDPTMFEQMAQSQMGLQEKLGGLESTLNFLKEQQEKANAPTPSEEDMLIAQIQERLGLKNLQETFESKLQEKESIISQMKNMLDEIQTERVVSQRQAQVDSLASKYQGFDENLIVKELQTMYQQNPQMAEALNNPQGWEMIWTSKYGNISARQPDAITPSETNGGDFGEETLSKFSSGTATSDDIADALFSYVK